MEDCDGLVEFCFQKVGGLVFRSSHGMTYRGGMARYSTVRYGVNIVEYPWDDLSWLFPAGRSKYGLIYPPDKGAAAYWTQHLNHPPITTSITIFST